MFRLTLRNNSKRRAAPDGHAVRRVGARREPLALAAARRHQPRPGHRRACWRATPSARSSASASPFSICTRATERTVTGDRTEFLGRNGTLREPAALRRRSLSDRTGAGLDPCGAIQVTVVLEPDQTQTVVGLLGDARGRSRRREPWCSAIASPRRSTTRCGEARAFWDDLLGTLAVSTPDRVAGPDAEPLAALPDPGLPHLGTVGVLSVERRLRLPRSAAGRAGAALSRAGARARAHPARRVAAVRRRRRAALVARAGRPGRAHALLRRSAVAGLRHAALHRRRPATVACSTSRSRSSRAVRSIPGEHEAYERPSISRQSALALRALRSRHRAEPRDRRARPAADRHRRLERRHEPGRRRRTRRERLARLVPAPHPARVRRRSPRPAAKTIAPPQYRRYADRLLAGVEEAWDGDWYRRAYFDDGTPLGSKENDECRIDAIAQSWAVIAGGGDPGPRAAGDGVGRRAAGAARGRPRAAADAAVRSHGAEPRLHPGLRARACGKTAGSTPTPRSGPCWRSPSSATAIARRSCSRCSIRSTTRGHRRKSPATAPSRTSSPPMSIRGRRTPAAAAGPGTRDRRGGCIASASKRFSASRSETNALHIDPVHPARLAAIRGGAQTAGRRVADRRREPGRREPRRALDRARWRRPGGTGDKARRVDRSTRRARGAWDGLKVHA